MTKRTAILAVALALVLGGMAIADDAKPVTLEGKITCAKCTLGATDVKECQNVLVVEKGSETGHFWLVKNNVSEEFGHACKGDKPAVVTGTVAEKDGKKWITATKMAPVPDKKA
jgi:hypothetical protein